MQPLFKKKVAEGVQVSALLERPSPEDKKKLGTLFSFVGIHLGSGNLRPPEIRIIDLCSGFR
jgi:hypothetical protein